MFTLQREFQTYESALPKLLKEYKSGQFVVIRGESVAKICDSYEQALDWAYDTFGLERFFVKEISAEEHVAHFSRDVGLCGP